MAGAGFFGGKGPAPREVEPSAGAEAEAAKSSATKK
jgi:hypothetical protein